MNSQRLFGIVMLVVGVILLFVGMNASQSMVEQLNQTFAGRFSDSTTWYIVGGLAAGLVGTLMLVFDLRRKAA
jgi:uncharacterized membrane protein